MTVKIMHSDIMFIRRKKTPKTPNRISIQIVESIRTGNKVSQSILRHVGIGETDEEVEQLISLAETIKTRLEEDRQPSLPLFSPDSFAEDRAKKQKDDNPINVNLRFTRRATIQRRHL